MAAEVQAQGNGCRSRQDSSWLAALQARPLQGCIVRAHIARLLCAVLLPWQDLTCTAWKPRQPLDLPLRHASVLPSHMVRHHCHSC